MSLDFMWFAVRLGLIFAHTDNYPDEPPLLEVNFGFSITPVCFVVVCKVLVFLGFPEYFFFRSLRGVNNHDLDNLKQKLNEEVSFLFY